MSQELIEENETGMTFHPRPGCEDCRTALGRLIVDRPAPDAPHLQWFVYTQEAIDFMDHVTQHVRQDKGL